MHKIQNLKTCQNGSIAIITVLMIGLILGILAFTTDLTRTQSASSDIQNASDSAALSAAQLLHKNYVTTGNIILTNDIRKYAEDTIKQNFSTNRKGTAPWLDDISVDATNLTLTVKACAKTQNNFSLNSKEFMTCSTSTSQISKVLNSEIAIVVDSSAAMGSYVGGVKKNGTRLAAAKAVLKSFSSKLQPLTITNYPQGISVSLIPYSDSVRLKDNAENTSLTTTANNWLRSPFTTPTKYFNGCMGFALNNNDKLDNYPNSTETKFDRYHGSYDLLYDSPNQNNKGVDSILDKIIINEYASNGKKIPSTVYSTGITKSLDSTGTVERIKISFPVNRDNGTTVKSNAVGAPDTLNGEVDYVSDVGSEKVQIDLGQSFTNSAGIYVQMFRWDDLQHECGNVDFYDEKITHIKSTAFCGTTFPFNVYFTAGSTKPFRYVNFSVQDNGTDLNADYILNSLYLPFSCAIQPSILLTGNKTKFDAAAKSLVADGPTRTNIGMGWGWRALSPKFKGQWDSTKPNLPENLSNSSKHMIVVTQGRNYNSAVDDAAQLEVCENIKNAGIDISYITFDADAATQALGQTCASSGHYYNAPTQAALDSAFSTIAAGIASQTETIKLVK